MKSRLRVALLLTTMYLVAELVGAWWSGSLALLADAAHMLTDVAGIGLSLFAVQLAERSPTVRRTYGFYRAEILATLANASVLLAMAGWILFEAYRRFIAPPAVDGGVMLAVATVGLLVNIAAALVLRRNNSASLNLKAAYLEVFSDLLSSVGVIVAAVIIRWTGWYPIDPLMSVGIGLFIVPRTWNLIREAVGILLEGTPANVDLAQIRTQIEQLPAVVGVHDLHVWSITSGLHALSIHVVRASDTVADEVLRRVQTLVTANFPISHVTIQIEPPGWREGETHL